MILHELYHSKTIDELLLELIEKDIRIDSVVQFISQEMNS